MFYFNFIKKIEKRNEKRKKDLMKFSSVLKRVSQSNRYIYL